MANSTRSRDVVLELRKAGNSHPSAATKASPERRHDQHPEPARRRRRRTGRCRRVSRTSFLKVESHVADIAQASRWIFREATSKDSSVLVRVWPPAEPSNRGRARGCVRACRSPFCLRMRGCRPTFRRGRNRRPRHPLACRSIRLAPARDSCRPASPAITPPSRAG